MQIAEQFRLGSMAVVGAPVHLLADLHGVIGFAQALGEGVVHVFKVGHDAFCPSVRIRWPESEAVIAARYLTAGQPRRSPVR